jgi:apolipoprotein N-acyltransferase
VKTFHLYLLALLSGLLLTFAWFPHGWIPLLFIAFVPLLLVEKSIYADPGKYRSITLFVGSYLAFFTWNILTTWWVKNASYGGAALAILANSLLMTLVFIAYHRVKKRVGEKWEYLILCSFWITWEFLHLDWDLTWPWLTLGNAFANTPSLIQWYEYTGVFGGGLWVLIINCMLVSCFVKAPRFYRFQINKKKTVAFITLLFIPVLISVLIAKNLKTDSAKKEKMVEVVVVQPNIDPYNEKFSGSVEEQVQRMLTLAAEKTDSATGYLIFPETALPSGIWEHELREDESILQLNAFLRKYPDLKIIIGASTDKLYGKNEELSATARKFTNEDGYYDSYNTALQLDKSGRIQVYHKSKLVPGVEKLPFPVIFKFLGDLAIDLGGTTGSLGIQEERSVFISPDKKWNAAPVICYESIYGEYVSGYVRNGANFIAIITNDGWWGDTPGYRQHLKYAVLRAIETRRWIARSANTGISCFISPSGEIQQATHWWVPAVIKAQMEMKNERTFYTRFGDYIARIAMYLSFLLIIYSWLIRFRIVKK